MCTVCEPQGDINKTAIIAKAGVRVIQSLGADYVAGARPWEDLYQQQFMPAGLTPEEQKNVIGGEACSWGETTDDSDIDTVIWPKACAIAERLWSPAPAAGASPDTA